MKPFNLEEAKAGKPVQTIAGKPVRIICFDKVGTDQRPIIALATCKDEYGEFELLVHAATDGTVLCGNMYDLRMAPVKREAWVNLYQSRGLETVRRGVMLYPTKEEAQLCAQSDVVATAHIEWEE